MPRAPPPHPTPLTPFPTRLGPLLLSLALRASQRPLHSHAHPQVSPDSFVLVAGAMTEVLVCFKPITAGPKDIKVRREGHRGRTSSAACAA